MSKYKDITNQKFGMLTAIEVANRINGVTKWLFRCDCGKEKIISSSSVCSGDVVSCGCYIRKLTSDRSKKHGKFGTPIYYVWDSMYQRCSNPNHKSYKDYGGRGISVCDRWRDFINFYGDMGDRPSPKHTIERIDVNKGYSPENCYWATWEQQSNNRRNTIKLTLNGETKCLFEWEKETGIKRGTMKSRIKLGWSDEKILTTPKLRPCYPRKRTE